MSILLTHTCAIIGVIALSRSDLPRKRRRWGECSSTTTDGNQHVIGKSRSDGISIDFSFLSMNCDAKPTCSFPGGPGTHGCMGIACNFIVHNLCAQEVVNKCVGGEDLDFFCSADCFYSVKPRPRGSGESARVSSASGNSRSSPLVSSESRGPRSSTAGASRASAVGGLRPSPFSGIGPSPRRSASGVSRSETPSNFDAERALSAARPPSYSLPGKVRPSPIYNAFHSSRASAGASSARQTAAGASGRVAVEGSGGSALGSANMGTSEDGDGDDVVEVVGDDEEAVPEEAREGGQVIGGRRSRRKQVVAPIGDRFKVQRWMSKKFAAGESDIPSSAMKAFPLLFQYVDEIGRQSAVKRAWRWFKEAQKKAQSSSSSSTEKHDNKSDILAITRRGRGIRKVYRPKALRGRGPKRQKWVEELNVDLNDMFRHVRRAGVKLNPAVLQEIALELIRDAPEYCSYNSSTRDKKTKKLISEHISKEWVRRFMDRFNIVVRDQTGKLQCSEEKELEIEHSVVVFLGEMCRGFQTGELDEDLISNMDETAFKIDMDSGKTLEYAGSEHVKYCEVVSGGQNFTMMVHVQGGRRGVILPPFMVFQNQDCNYPIKGVPDDVPGISYRTGKKGWMDARVMALMLKERRFVCRRPDGRKQIIFLDNVGSHNTTPELETILKELNIELRYFPPNATHLVQPCDSFVIQIIKAAWRKRWDAKKAQDVLSGQFRNGKNGSGKVINPGKHYFLELGAEAVQAARMRTDDTGLNYARKAMIICGLSNDVDGIWKVGQLRTELQAMIRRNQGLFDKVVARTYSDPEVRAGEEDTEEEEEED